jgi:hypothetical protein
MRVIREHNHKQRPPLEWQRRGQLREAIESYWARCNPGVPLVWGPADEKAATDLVRMSRLCGWDYEQLVRNRENTPNVNHATRPSKWIRSLGNYVRAPSPANE